MTTDAQRAANRRNARRSTGPRTAQGKAAASRNARRHGATVAPSPGRVATWVRVIRGDPDARPPALISADRQTALALALAEAEARLSAARSALEAHRADPLAQGRDPEFEALFRDEAEALVSEARQDGGWTPKRLRAFGQLVRIRMRYRALMGRGVGKRELLLYRYLREAQSQRDRAFANWIAYLAEQRVSPAPSSEPKPRTLGTTAKSSRNGDLPKRSQIQS